MSLRVDDDREEDEDERWRASISETAVRYEVAEEKSTLGFLFFANMEGVTSERLNAIGEGIS